MSFGLPPYAKPNTTEVFHGTTKARIASILENGFDQSMSKPGLYGQD